MRGPAVLPFLRKLRRGAVLLGFVRKTGLIWLKRFLLTKLNESPGREGKCSEIELHFLEGLVVLRGVQFARLSGGQRVVEIRCAEISINVDWRSLLHGTFVGRVELREPYLEINADHAGEHEGERPGKSPNDALLALCRETQRFMPFRLRSVEVLNGRIDYLRRSPAPPFKLTMEQISLFASNLTNIKGSTAAETAQVYVTGKTTGDGEFRLQFTLPSLSDTLTFKLRVELKKVNLVALNDVLRAYAKFDVHRGTCSILAEFTVGQGRYRGIVQPHFRNLDVFAWEKEHGKSLFQIIRQVAIGFLAGLFKNQARDELALNIPISGTFSDGDVDTWSAVGSLLKNAFVRSLFPDPDRIESKLKRR